MDPAEVDPYLLVPNVAWGDALRFSLFAVFTAALPGEAIRRLAAWHAGGRIERWAISLLVGILWSTAAYLALLLGGVAAWQLPVAALPVGVWLGAAMYGRVRGAGLGGRVLRRGGKAVKWRQHLQSLSAGQWAGLALLAAFISWHVCRVASLVEYDAGGLRLYGVFYSDKFTNMSPAAALMHDVPPANLRLGGHTFATHYFPHAFVAAAARGSGVDYIDGFWFYAPALGILATGLAVLAFARRMFKSPVAAIVALAAYGVYRFGPAAKPLDLSIALFLVALLAIERWQAARRRRWALLAAATLGAMPCYEVFFALAAHAGLAAWWGLGLVDWAWNRVRGVALVQRARTQFFMRCAVVLPAGCVALLSGRLLLSSEQVSTPPAIVAQNTYRKSFSHDWREWGGRYPLLESVYLWQRGKEAPPPWNLAEAPRRAGDGERLACRLIYHVGFVVYVFIRFVNAGVFGLIALAGWQLGRWRLVKGSREQIAAGASTWAIVGGCVVMALAVPLFVNWGHQVKGVWWWTPNLYRFPQFALLLLLLVGAGAMWQAICFTRRPASLAPLAIAIAGLAHAAWFEAGLEPVHTYHLVERSRLSALAFLRENVPYDEIVIHPWVDDVIHRDDAPGETTSLYGRHFTLGSNLAGRQMYYEGREEHLFNKGQISVEEVLQRSRLRRKFYGHPGAFAVSPSPPPLSRRGRGERNEEMEAVQRVIGQDGLNWVVADNAYPAPWFLASHWRVAYDNGAVRVYRRPEREVLRVSEADRSPSRWAKKMNGRSMLDTVEHSP